MTLQRLPQTKQMWCVPESLNFGIYMVYRSIFSYIYIFIYSSEAQFSCFWNTNLRISVCVVCRCDSNRNWGNKIIEMEFNTIRRSYFLYWHIERIMQHQNFWRKNIRCPKSLNRAEVIRLGPKQQLLLECSLRKNQDCSILEDKQGLAGTGKVVRTELCNWNF